MSVDSVSTSCNCTEFCCTDLTYHQSTNPPSAQPYLADPDPYPSTPSPCMPLPTYLSSSSFLLATASLLFSQNTYLPYTAYLRTCAPTCPTTTYLHTDHHHILDLHPLRPTANPLQLPVPNGDPASSFVPLALIVPLPMISSPSGQDLGDRFAPHLNGALQVALRLRRIWARRRGV